MAETKHTPGWVSFEDAQPAPGRKVIISNNIDSRDAHGEYSHVWMVPSDLIRWCEADGEYPVASWRAIVGVPRVVHGCTHWRYATPLTDALEGIAEPEAVRELVEAARALSRLIDFYNDGSAVGPSDDEVVALRAALARIDGGGT